MTDNRPQDMRQLTADQIKVMIMELAETTTKDLRYKQEVNRSMIKVAVTEVERRKHGDRELAEMGLANTQIMECIIAGAIHQKEFGEYWDGGALRVIEPRTT